MEEREADQGEARRAGREHDTGDYTSCNDAAGNHAPDNHARPVTDADTGTGTNAGADIECWSNSGALARTSVSHIHARGAQSSLIESS